SEGGQQGYLGVQLGGGEGGAEVVEVVDGTPAKKAGLESGDKIVKVDSTDIGSSEDLVKAVRSHKPGDKVSVGDERRGEKGKAKVTLGSAESIDMHGGAGVGRAGEPSVEPPSTTPAGPSSREARRARGGAPAAAEQSAGVERQLEEMRAQVEQLRRELEEL